MGQTDAHSPMSGSNMDYVTQAKRVIALEIAELNRLHDRLDDNFARAVELLKDCVERRSKIVVAGVGKSGNIGSKMVATFNSTGAPAVVLDCQDALHGDLGLVNDRDAVVALSYSGETVELLNLIPHLKRRNNPIIAITGHPRSTLARHSDCVLDVEVEREACPLILAPTSSTTNTLALGDALAMVLLEARGFRKEHFAELHPGGSLGHALLTRAEDIMRRGVELVTVTEERVVREVLRLMTDARTGAAVVVDGEGRLTGIFTQGDFTRAYQETDSIGDRRIGEVMTRNPVAVSTDRLVGEVLSLLETHRIDDLVVLDADGRPVGLIDTQDLTRLKIV